MMNSRRKCVAFTLMLALLAVGCSTKEKTKRDVGNTDATVETKPIIAATNFALQSMAEVIVGDFADVIRPRVQLEPKGGLNMEEVFRMQEATVVLTNGPGADDAAWLNLISIDQSRVFAATSAEFELSDFIQVEDYRTVHSHGDEGEHSHPWLVPHCWLNPRLAIAQSLGVCDYLIKKFPEQGSAFTANHRLLSQELELVEELAGEVRELIQSKRVTVIASDPRLLFFTRALGLPDDYFLWFEPPEISAAIAELEKRKLETEKKLLLLCPKSVGLLSDEWSNSTGIAIATVSLIEEVEGKSDGVLQSEAAELGEAAELRDSQGFVSELRANFQTLKTVVEGIHH